MGLYLNHQPFNQLQECTGSRYVIDHDEFVKLTFKPPKPPVELGRALEWVLGHKSDDLDASLVFGKAISKIRKINHSIPIENDCVIAFKDGKYERFENLFEDED